MRRVTGIDVHRSLGNWCWVQNTVDSGIGLQPWSQFKAVFPMLFADREGA